jgi:hypothetical protein
MKNFCVTAIVSCFALSAIAAGPNLKPTTENLDMTQLKKMALAETSIEGKEQKSATNARTEGMLSLKDPRPEIITRSWQYLFGLTLQSFQPQGTVQTSLAGEFDLSNNDSTVLPAIEFGAMSPLMATGPALWRVGGKAKLAYSSQKIDVTLPSGYEVDDARLNTSMLSVGPAFSVQHERLNWLALTGTYQFGDLNYTQTSSTELANFSKHGGFESVGLGLQFQLTKGWAVSTEWSDRKLRSDETIALQKNNFELGTSVTW